MSDYREILERALLSEAGLKVAFKIESEAHRFRHGCNRLRKQDRIDDARERKIPREHGKSQFDNLMLKWAKSDPLIVLIEHGAIVEPVSIEDIISLSPVQTVPGGENNG